LLFAFLVFARSQLGADELPTIDQILERYVKALGGKKAIESLSSRVSKATFEIPEFMATGTIEIYEKSPDKTLTFVNAPGFGEIRTAYNGKVGWVEHPMFGKRELKGVALAALKRDAQFHKDLKYKQLYSKLTVKGKERFGERDAYVVEATPSEGPVDLMYFDAESALLIGSQLEREEGDANVTLKMRMEDYREVDGVKVPFTIHQKRAEFTLITKISEVKHNVDIDDKKFDKPGS
jgi:hypothetical protein